MGIGHLCYGIETQKYVYYKDSSDVGKSFEDRIIDIFSLKAIFGTDLEFVKNTWR